MKLLIVISLFYIVILSSCATVPAYVPMDDFNTFRYDTNKRLDSLEHKAKYDGPTWEMR